MNEYLKREDVLKIFEEEPVFGKDIIMLKCYFISNLKSF